MIIRTNKKRLGGNEKDLLLVIGLTWPISVFLGNYAFYRIGIMSFLPWMKLRWHLFKWLRCLTMC